MLALSFLIVRFMRVACTTMARRAERHQRRGQFGPPDQHRDSASNQDSIGHRTRRSVRRSCGSGQRHRHQEQRSCCAKRNSIGAHVCGVLRSLWRPLVPRWPGVPPADSAAPESAAGMGITIRSGIFGPLFLAIDVDHDCIEEHRDRTGTANGRMEAANVHRPRGETLLPGRPPGDRGSGSASRGGLQLRCPRVRLPHCGFLSFLGLPQSRRDG